MEQTDFECPKCGANLMENNLLYACEKESLEGADKCDFKLWKKNKLLGVEIDDLIFQSLNSAEGYAFERGIMRIDVSNPYFTSVEWKNDGNKKFPVRKEFHLLELTTKDGRELSFWKDEIQNEEDNDNRKTIFSKFCGWDVTEEEAKKLFNDESVQFDNLKSKKGETFTGKGKLEFNDSKKQWEISLTYDK